MLFAAAVTCISCHRLPASRPSAEPQPVVTSVQPFGSVLVPAEDVSVFLSEPSSPGVSSYLIAYPDGQVLRGTFNPDRTRTTFKLYQLLEPDSLPTSWGLELTSDEGPVLEYVWTTRGGAPLKVPGLPCRCLLDQATGVTAGVAVKDAGGLEAGAGLQVLDSMQDQYRVAPLPEDPGVHLLAHAEGLSVTEEYQKSFPPASVPRDAVVVLPPPKHPGLAWVPVRLGDGSAGLCAILKGCCVLSTVSILGDPSPAEWARFQDAMGLEATVALAGYFEPSLHFPGGLPQCVGMKLRALVRDQASLAAEGLHGQSGLLCAKATRYLDLLQGFVNADVDYWFKRDPEVFRTVAPGASSPILDAAISSGDMVIVYRELVDSYLDSARRELRGQAERIQAWPRLQGPQARSPTGGRSR